MMNKRVYALCRLALLSAVAITLSVLEGVFTPVLPVGAKAGLSNVVVMLAADTLGFSAALAITLLKAAFALLTRGAVSALLSLLGGVASALLLWVLFRYARSLGTLGISMIGAVTHSTAQLFGSYLLYGTAVFAYAPLLLLFSLPSGVITAALLGALSQIMKGKRSTNDKSSL